MQIRTVSLEKAPAILRLARALEMFMLILPVIVLFYQYKGLTIGDFFLIRGIFSLIIFCLEIPTGYIGDVFSRKKVIFAAIFSYFLGGTIWYFFHGFFFILLGEIFIAASMSLYSGTAEAYLYDVLKKQGKERNIIKEQGKLDTYAIWSTTIATFIGGAIYKYSPDMTILLETIIVGIASIIVLFLPDINKEKIIKKDINEKTNNFKNILNITKFAINHTEIRWLTLYHSAFLAGTTVLLWSLQPLMDNSGVPVVLFGLFVGLNQFFRGIFANFSDSLFKKFQTNKLSVILFFILTLGVIATFTLPSVNNIIFIYVLILLIGFAEGSQTSLKVVTSGLINHRTKSEERATVLSVRSMANKAFTGTAMISLKFLIDGVGLQITFAIVGIIILAITAYSLIKLLRLKII